MTDRLRIDPARDHQRPLLAATAALLGAGFLLGVSTNLAKVAGGVGIAPLAYLAWSLAGAAALLTTVAVARRRTTALNRRTLEYYVVSALLGVAGSNLILFSAVPRLGVSFVALVISLPPLLTYVGALALGMERFCTWRAAGVTLALGGTAALVARQWSVPGTDPAWIALTLLGPVLLAAGNLYRTRRWPPGASADALAPGMLVAAVLVLGLCAMLPGWSIELPVVSRPVLVLVAVQALVFAGQFQLMFVLQQRGGPVFLSLMGAVSAVFGVPIALVVLAESAPAGLATGASLVALGVACMALGLAACRPSNPARQARPNNGKSGAAAQI